MNERFFHICISSPYEVMMRTIPDYIQAINRMALAAENTNTMILAYAFMSNHIHLVVYSNNPGLFVSRFRNSYSQWFNSKYSRSGSLGSRGYLAVELTSEEQILTALAYSNRNPAHHGIVTYPNEYPFSSSRYFFMNELGIHNSYDILQIRKEISEHLSINRKLPYHFKMDKSGMLIPETFLQIALGEKMFRTPKRFIYFMTRDTSREWLSEAEKWFEAGEAQEDAVDKEFDPDSDRNVQCTGLRINQNTRMKHKITDIELCTLIEEKLIKEKTTISYVALSFSEKNKLVNYYRIYHFAGNNQLKRCLAIK